jgi:hypothetical protein
MQNFVTTFMGKEMTVLIPSFQIPTYPRLVVRFLNNILFTGWGCQPHAQPPTCKARVSLLVWTLPFDLSGVGDPTSSQTTVGIALQVTESRKPHRCGNSEDRQWMENICTYGLGSCGCGSENGVLCSTLQTSNSQYKGCPKSLDLIITN